LIIEASGRIRVISPIPAGCYGAYTAVELDHDSEGSEA
jgi:hypothetical protein